MTTMSRCSESSIFQFNFQRTISEESFLALEGPLSDETGFLNKLACVVCCACVILFILIFVRTSETIEHIWGRYFQKDFVTIGILEGKVAGRMLRGVFKPEDNIYYFPSIPYGEAPTGKRRFRLPVPKAPWSGVYNGSLRINDRCAQPQSNNYFSLLPQPFSDNEDCLTLDVYAPEIAVRQFGSKLREVIILLHGGSFQTGSKSDNIYNARTLSFISNSVVVVPNYRLNIFGFAYANRSNIPGNMGLWDQVLAMDWIQRNIPYFGGDPEQITLWGIDSGAVSAGAHTFSSVTNIYFRNVIMQGGSPLKLGFDAFARKQELFDVARLFCSASTELTVCLKDLQVSDLLTSLQEYNGFFKLAFGPNLSGNDGLHMPDFYRCAFDPPLAHVGASVRNVLLGFAQNEGQFYLRNILAEWHVNNLEQFPLPIIRLIVERLILRYFRPQRLPAIFAYYFGSVRRTQGESVDDIYVKAAAFLGDVLVKCPVKNMADVLSDMGAGVFVYEFFYPLRNLSRVWWSGSPHFSDAFLSTGAVFHEPKGDIVDRNFSTRLMEKFAHFSRHGTPTRKGDVHWPRYYRNDPKVAYISYSLLRVKTFSRIAACEFLLENSRIREGEEDSYEPPSRTPYITSNNYVKSDYSEQTCIDVTNIDDM